jgi:hypothetical protein
MSVCAPADTDWIHKQTDVECLDECYVCTFSALGLNEVFLTVYHNM